MVVHSYYDEDPRVRREAESLVAAGYDVDVFALRRPSDPPVGTVAGVTVHRLDVQRHQGAGIGVYLREYVSFVIRSSWALTRAYRHRRHGLVQVHTLPDFLALAALPLRLVGVPLILDLHEAMPEFFRSRFPRASNPVVHRLLLAQETVSTRIASAIVTVNEAMAGRLVDRGVSASKIVVVPNAASLGRFDPGRFPARPFAEDGAVRMVYAGALTPIYELDVAIDAMAALRSTRPDLDLRLDVYGRGDAEPRLRERVDGAGLAERVAFHGRIAIEDVPAAIAAADIGLAPTRRDRFTDVSLSTKLFEYGAMDKPVVATRLPMVEATFPPGSVWMYEPGTPESLATVIARVVDDPDARRAGVRATRAIVEAGSWERHAEPYLALVDRLLTR